MTRRRGALGSVAALVLLAALLPGPGAAQAPGVGVHPGILQARADAGPAGPHAPSPERLPPPASLPEGVSLEQEVRSWPVRGVSRDALTSWLYEHAPALGRKRVWGRTDWTLRYRYRTRSGPEGCGLEGVRIRVAATVLLPSWRDRERAPAAVRRRWDLFRRALVEHEVGHRDRALEVGTMLRRRLARVRAPDCRSLEAEVAAVLEEVVSRGDALQTRYDGETRDGRAQGVRWPW